MSYLNDQWDHYLTREQVELLLKPIHKKRVHVRDGMAYVEAFDIKAEMTRVFGFARWSSVVTEQVLLFEEQKQSNAGKPVWYVGYRSRVRIGVHAPDGTFLAEYEEGHAGDSTHPVRGEAHGNAITNSESYAFKRAAVMALLDQGGNSLYAKGSLEPQTRWTLVMPPADGDAQRWQPNTDDVPEVVPESEQQDPAPDLHVQSEPPKETTDEDKKALRVADLTAQLLAAEGRAAVAGISAQVMKEKLGAALTYDADENALTLGALVDVSLKRVTARARASA